jgi:hypothetical protein
VGASTECERERERERQTETERESERERERGWEEEPWTECPRGLRFRRRARRLASWLGQAGQGGGAGRGASGRRPRDRCRLAERPVRTDRAPRSSTDAREFRSRRGLFVSSRLFPPPTLRSLPVQFPFALPFRTSLSHFPFALPFHSPPFTRLSLPCRPTASYFLPARPAFSRLNEPRLAQPLQLYASFQQIVRSPRPPLLRKIVYLSSDRSRVPPLTKEEPRLDFHELL